MPILAMKCNLCGDSGAVPVWHPATLMSLRRKENPVSLVEATTACTCKLGVRYAFKAIGQDTLPWLDRFGDRNWHVRRTVRPREHNGTIYNPLMDVMEAGSDALISYINGHPAPNYRTEFDDFNKGDLKP